MSLKLNVKLLTGRKYILEGYGRLQTKLWAAEALLDRTAHHISKLIHAPRGELTQQARGEIAVGRLSGFHIVFPELTLISEVVATKFNAIEISLEVGSKIFELTGARSSLGKYGLDRFWRNTRGMSFEAYYLILQENALTNSVQFTVFMILHRIKCGR
jgi:alkylation response protein AidB-like acyl-CoA dehydrogenase